MNDIEEIYQVDKLNILDCSKIKFSKEKSGFLSFEYNGDKYEKANPTRLLPFLSKTTYISISYENSEKEFREIGVIHDMNDLSDEQYKILDTFLEYKYYMPQITKIYSIKDNMRGAIFVKVDTSSGSKTLCIRDWYQNFKMINAHYLYVVDADGNKYFCPDIDKLDKKSLQVMEMFT